MVRSFSAARSPAPKPRGNAAPTLRDAVLKAVQDESELFLDEMTDVVNALSAGADHAVEVSPASVSRILARNGYTRKITEEDFSLATRPSGLSGLPPNGKSRSAAASKLMKLIGWGGRSSVGGRAQSAVCDPSVTSHRLRGRGRAFWRDGP